MTLLRPVASAPGSSRRSRREYATILDLWSHQHADENGIAACEEARRVLAGLGALDLSDLGSASAYADTSDSAAGIALVVGRLDDALRLAQEALGLAEKILKMRPGHLRALKARALAHHRIAHVEARRFRPELALEWADKSAAAFDVYATFEPSHAVGWRFRLISDLQAAQALLAQGRVTAAEKRLRAAIALGDETPHRAAARWPISMLWLELATMLAQRGDRAAAENSLGEATRVQEMLNHEFENRGAGRLLDQEFVEQSRRVIRLSFQEYAAANHAARAALVRVEGISKRSDIAMARKEDLDTLRRAAWIDSARTDLRLGRFTEAEHAARAAARGPQGNGSWANLETNRAFVQTLLGLTIARQDRLDEARAAITPALRVYRELQKKDADGVDFSHDFAFCLYAHAIAWADTPGGRVERSTALDEAMQLLARFSDEAKALCDVRELIELIAVERAKQKGKP